MLFNQGFGVQGLGVRVSGFGFGVWSWGLGWDVPPDTNSPYWGFDRYDEGLLV